MVMNKNLSWLEHCLKIVHARRKPAIEITWKFIFLFLFLLLLVVEVACFLGCCLGFFVGVLVSRVLSFCFAYFFFYFPFFLFCSPVFWNLGIFSFPVLLKHHVSLFSIFTILIFLPLVLLPHFHYLYNWFLPHSFSFIFYCLSIFSSYL